MATDLARTLSARGELVLRRRDDDALELRVNGVFVMDTHETSTERALARAALALPAPSRVLVGGLGLGFTTAELLADPRVQEVLVAEIEPAVVGWMRDGTVPHGPAVLADPRLRVQVGDVRDVVEEQPYASLDAVLLDVDNGPDFLVLDANARLYRSAFLGACLDRLHPAGALLIWSSTRSAALEQALGRLSEWTVDEHEVDLAGRPDTYAVYSARRRHL
jgi:spermidine synthase